MVHTAPAPIVCREDWRLALDAAKRRRLRRWFWSIAAATVGVLIVGGITRLTQSGLSIVDWQPVIGVVPPLNDAQGPPRSIATGSFRSISSAPGSRSVSSR